MWIWGKLCNWVADKLYLILSADNIDQFCGILLSVSKRKVGELLYKLAEQLLNSEYIQVLDMLDRLKTSFLQLLVRSKLKRLVAVVCRHWNFGLNISFAKMCTCRNQHTTSYANEQRSCWKYLGIRYLDGLSEIL